ncbi:hypothetical protein QYF50_06990 [Paenibacillus vini]|uniref:hypothetical protein n=1 Tax=Paenibacillus vini TaxID=1476024 RepID=UPI0025B6C2C1|nr:hypothetical protein [Paenibacillus vini]MDN4067637.1 hypothetical protein [Paenibacillus vini]
MNITIEERRMLRDYLLLPHIETMIQKSIDELEYSSNILRQLYIKIGLYVRNRVVSDMKRLRKELMKRNIKVLGDQHTDFVVYYDYYCRGYEERFAMTRDVMRTEISLRLTSYITEVAEMMKSPRQ